MIFRFHPDALREYEAAVEFYESRHSGLGERFILVMEDALESIREAPERWPFLVQDVRRRLVRVFPYAVLYTLEPDQLLVVGIMHCHRRPGYWLSRLSGK